MPGSLKICFAASEVAPLAKTGGLADVAAALPAELLRTGHDVRTFVPFYSTIDRGTTEFAPVDSIRDIEIQVGAKAYRFTVFTPKSEESDTPLYLIDCPELYARSTIYTKDDDEAQRFTLFSRAVIECCQRLAWAPDVFHCNDWHTALIPFLLRSVYDWDALFKNSRTLVTIHNIGYQGNFPASVVGAIGLEPWTHLFDQGEIQAGRVNFLRTGLIYADAISTVSPTYAREIQTEEYGMGLQHLLQSRSEVLVGILNGVDYEVWSPERDAWIAHPYSPGHPEGKRKNKRHLMESLGLTDGERLPLAGIISRLAYQKGFDLCFDVLPEPLSANAMRLVVLGSGEARYEELFVELQKRFPGRVCYHQGYHDELAHMIEAASDIFLMPSRYEPCGLNQMFGMKYGTLPIVRKTGGLADTVTPVDGESGRGTGFVFEHFTADGLRWALDQALTCYRNTSLWKRLMMNAMQENFSWEVQSRPYVELYSRMLQR